MGGLRAAHRIKAVYNAGPMPLAEFRKLAAGQVKDEVEEIRRLLKSPASAPPPGQVRGEIQDRMTADGAFLRSAARPFYHPAGTCRMGADANAVVGPDLRVKGADALRVADISIFPRHIAGNTNATALMIGEKAADLIANP